MFAFGVVGLASWHWGDSEVFPTYEEMSEAIINAKQSLAESLGQMKTYYSLVAMPNIPQRPSKPGQWLEVSLVLRSQITSTIRRTPLLTPQGILMVKIRRKNS